MQDLAIVLGIILVFIIQAIIWPIQLRKRRRAKLLREFGADKKLPPLDEMDMESIRIYHDLLKEHEPTDDIVDDITWADLDMDSLFQLFNHTQSIAGEQMLYATLRRTGADAETVARRVKMGGDFIKENGFAVDAMLALHKMGKRRIGRAADYLFVPELKAPGKAFPYVVLGFAPLLLIPLCFLYPPTLFLLIAVMIINPLIYMRMTKRWRSEIESACQLAGLLGAGKQLSKLNCPDFSDELSKLREAMAKLGSAHRYAQLLLPEAATPLDTAMLMYLKVQNLMEIIALCRLSTLVKKQSEALRAVYECVGTMDAMIAMAWLRMARGDEICDAKYHAGNEVNAQNVIHPLIEHAVPNSIDWRGGILITGSNASGKSTFTKAVAINAILAQSVGFAFAESLTLPRAKVLSSMALRDSILRGESYFVVEVRSLKRILDAASSGSPAMCFIDEILRGTNTIERVAASRALLSELAKTGALIMAATHDIELTRALPSYRNVHFKETLDDSGMSFDYKLLEGASNTRNAIALMKQMGFPKSLTDEAEGMANG